MSATEVLRRAGSQKAAVESSAMELRPTSRPVLEESNEMPVAAAPMAPRPARPQGERNYNVLPSESEPGAARETRGPRPERAPQAPRDGRPAIDRPIQEGAARSDRPDGAPRRRRRRGGRGGRDRNLAPGERPAFGDRPQGQQGMQQGRPQGGFSQQQRSEQRPSTPSQNGPKKAGLWSRIKGALGLDAKGKAPKNTGQFDDKW
jgi:hypothetical protein